MRKPALSVFMPGEKLTGLTPERSMNIVPFQLAMDQTAAPHVEVWIKKGISL